MDNVQLEARSARKPINMTNYFHSKVKWTIKFVITHFIWIQIQFFVITNQLVQHITAYTVFITTDTINDTNINSY